jgi:Flp pilus assembly protein TadG
MTHRLLPCDRRGASALEFALVAPFVLVLMIGLIDVARLLSNQQALDHGVAVAARWAVVNSASASTASIQAKFKRDVQALLGDCDGCSIKVAFDPSAQPGAAVTIAATYPWMPVAPITLLPARNLTSSATMTIQN